MSQRAFAKSLATTCTEVEEAFPHIISKKDLPTNSFPLTHKSPSSTSYWKGQKKATLGGSHAWDLTVLS